MQVQTDFHQLFQATEQDTTGEDLDVFALSAAKFPIQPGNWNRGALQSTTFSAATLVPMLVFEYVGDCILDAIL